MADHASLIESYLQGVLDLQIAVSGMSREQLLARPVPGRWSTLEVVVHIADFEPVFADRIRRIIALDRPLLLTADENEYVKHLVYDDRDVAEEMNLIHATRQSTARLLRSLSAEAWQRVGIHAYKGLVSLESIVTSAAGHIPSHLKFVYEKRAALGLS